MLRSQLDLKLQQIHPGLFVKRYSNRGEHIYHGGNDAVYFHNLFIGSIPPGNIYVSANPKYVNQKGYAHRSLRGLVHRLKAKNVLRRQYDTAARQLLAG